MLNPNTKAAYTNTAKDTDTNTAKDSDTNTVAYTTMVTHTWVNERNNVYGIHMFGILVYTN